MNKVFLIGNLTKDVELTTTNSGLSVAKFTIACQRKYENAEGEREADFIPIVVWRGQADNCSKYLKKGSKCCVVGSIQTRSYENEEGLLIDPPGWSFMDWVPDWDYYGNAPNGRRSLSALNNLLYVYALKSVARAEDSLGDGAMAAYWRARADRTARASVARFWCEEKGMIADTAAKNVFSEHAQCLALLTGILSKEMEKRAFQGLLESKNLARTTVYFSHYLFETYLKYGRADLFLKRLDLWRGYLAEGLKTPVEAPGVRARSDCHAWGAHPLYHLQTGIAGIKPAANGFSAVSIAPQSGGLKWVSAASPTPKGEVVVDLRFEGTGVSGSVTLPSDLPGTFEWKGERRTLASGVNFIDIKGN